MKPVINGTTFGSITIGGKCYTHDVVISLNGKVKKRKKKLSQQMYGTSHTVSLQEAEDMFEPGATHLIIGTGQYGYMALSPKAAAFFSQQSCGVELLPTAKAIARWNSATGAVIGMFHTTC